MSSRVVPEEIAGWHIDQAAQNVFRKQKTFPWSAVLLVSAFVSFIVLAKYPLPFPLPFAPLVLFFAGTRRAYKERQSNATKLISCSECSETMSYKDFNYPAPDTKSIGSNLILRGERVYRVEKTRKGPVKINRVYRVYCGCYICQSCERYFVASPRVEKLAANSLEDLDHVEKLADDAAKNMNVRLKPAKKKKKRLK